MSHLRQMLLDDIGYTAWANQTLLAVCSRLTPDVLGRDLGASHQGLLNTLRHIYYAERAWLRRLLADALPPLVEIGDQRLFADAAPEPILEELAQRWPEVWQGMCEWLNQSQDDLLTGRMRTVLPGGGEFLLSRAEIIMHAVNHSTLHRGQIVSMLRALGVKPPNTDMFSYYMVRQA